MVDVPDYSFISKDSGPSLSGSINNWLTIDKNVYDLKEKQAQQAIGNILQQSTDAQGNVDYGTANALAAKAGPGVQMGMQTMLQANSARRGEQINQGQAINTNITRAGVSLMMDSSDANVNATFDNLISTNPGLRQLYEGERQRVLAMPDPKQRQLYAHQHVLGDLDAADKLISQGYGKPVMTQFGGTSASVVSTPGSPYGPPRTVIGDGIPHAPSPETYYTPQDSIIMYDANGNETNDPTKAVRKVPRVVPRGPAFNMPPPGSVGGPPSGGSSAGPPPIPPPPSGAVIIQNGRIVPRPAAPAVLAAPPSGAPGGGPSTYHGPGFGMLPGPGASLSNGGVNVASADPSFAPGVGASAPPSPAVSGDVSAIVAGMNQARATPSLPGTQTAFNAIQNAARATGPAPAPAAVAAPPPPAARPSAPPVGVITGLPTGTEETTKAGMEADQKQFIADRAAQEPRQTREQNLRHAYDALKLITTGKGTENASAIRNILTTVGMAPPAMANDEAIYEYGRKYLERTIAEAGNVGGTDTARALAAQSNPNVSLVNPANLAFLRNDIGKARQQMAAYMTAPDTTIGKGYGKHAADTASKTDYRGFNWDDYSGPEQKQIMQSVGKEGTPAHDALARAIGMGRAFWPTKGGGPMIPHSEAAPMAPPNALAMAQPQGNPLLAA